VTEKLECTLEGEDDYRDVIALENLRFQDYVFRPHLNIGPVFSNSCLWFEERFRKAPFLVRSNVDGRPNRRNKAAFSNFSGLMCAGP